MVTVVLCPVMAEIAAAATATSAASRANEHTSAAGGGLRIRNAFSDATIKWLASSYSWWRHKWKSSV